jgi:hypothetical protein
MKIQISMILLAGFYEFKIDLLFAPEESDLPVFEDQC